MASIAIDAGTLRQKTTGAGLIGVTKPTGSVPPVQAPPSIKYTEPVANFKQEPSELERVVRKMPALYVITFFGVVVACAVLIIWNTLQVNRLTLERTKLDDNIAQTEQRLLRLRAEEMQLSASSRIDDLARTKLGMTEATGEDIVIIK
jgi:cell division protein FtsL